MAVCEICGKSSKVANSVSHANNKRKKRVYPNIQRVRIRYGNGYKKVKVCTHCLKKFPEIKK